jgi:hypothetical protein
MANDKKLLFLDKFFKKQKLKEKLKDIPICEIAEVIRQNLHARGVLVMIDHDYGDYGGTQIGSSNIEKEQAIKLFQYWSDELIEERGKR